MFKFKRKTIAELQNELTSLKAINTQLLSNSRSADTLREQIKEIAAARDKFRNQVRDQTSADILLNALRATGIAPDEKRETGYYCFQERALQSRLRGLQGEVNPFGADSLMGMAAFQNGPGSIRWI